MKPSWRRGVWIVAWIDLVEALAVILTFGYWQPNWAMRYLAWTTLKEIKGKSNGNAF